MTKWSDPGYRSGARLFSWSFIVLGIWTAGGRLLSWSGSALDVPGVVLGSLQVLLGVINLIWLRRATRRAREEERGDVSVEDATHTESAP